MSDHFRFESIDFTSGDLNPSYPFASKTGFKSKFNGFIIQNNLTVDVEVRGESGTSADYILIPAGSNKKVVVTDDLANEVLWFSGGADGDSLQVEWAANIENIDIVATSGIPPAGSTSLYTKPGQYNAIPVSLSDGTVTHVAVDINGRIIIAGYNDSTEAVQNELINPVEYAPFGPITMLDAVTATGASTEQNPENFKVHTFTVVSTGTATIEIQQSPDGTNWSTIAPVNATGTEVNTVSVENRKYIYVRANVTSYTSGAHSVIYNAGN